MKIWGLLIFLSLPILNHGQESQSFKITSHPLFNGVPIKLNAEYADANGNSIRFSTIKYYLSHFEFEFLNNITFQEEQSYHLIDIENIESSSWEILVPRNLEVDQMTFHLGIDSLTNVSGAMSGDLDPTLGMYWTWQSGYINVKLEGVFNNEEFVYHLGGYAGKLNALQSAEVSQLKSDMNLDLELASLFKTPTVQSVMSPSAHAVEMSKILAESIRAHE